MIHNLPNCPWWSSTNFRACVSPQPLAQCLQIPETSLPRDHPCVVLTFELLPYLFFHWRLNFPFRSFIQIESHSTCLWQTPTCPAWLSYCREQRCSLLPLAPWSPHCLCREAMLTPNCHREQQLWLRIRSVSFTLTFVFYCFCFKLRMLPIAWNIQDSPFSRLWPLRV